MKPSEGNVWRKCLHSVFKYSSTRVNVAHYSPALLSVLSVVEMGHRGAVSCLLALKMLFRSAAG